VEKGNRVDLATANDIAYRAAGAARKIRESGKHVSMWLGLVDQNPPELRSLIRTYLKQHLRSRRQQGDKQTVSGDAAIEAIGQKLEGE
jgi:hypothetical protein